MRPSGGTEILLNNLTRRLNFSGVNLIVSNCSAHNIDPLRTNILWQHLNTNEEAVKNLHYVKDRYDMIVFVSDWQREKFIKEFYLDPNKCITIRNAIEPIMWRVKPHHNPVKLIYTSTPWRGLNELLNAFSQVLPGPKLTVFSSTIIYGDAFNSSVGDSFAWLYEKCKNTKNCTYRSYAFNRVIREELLNSHIFAYPSTFEETSCLAAIEAGAAGCKIVTTPLGALTETCSRYATFASLNEYAKVLQDEVDNYSPKDSKEISDYYNDTYSWNVRINEWRELLKNI